MYINIPTEAVNIAKKLVRNVETGFQIDTYLDELKLSNMVAGIIKSELDNRASITPYTRSQIEAFNNGEENPEIPEELGNHELECGDYAYDCCECGTQSIVQDPYSFKEHTHHCGEKKCATMVKLRGGE